MPNEPQSLSYYHNLLDKPYPTKIRNIILTVSAEMASLKATISLSCLSNSRPTSQSPNLPSPSRQTSSIVKPPSQPTPPVFNPPSRQTSSTVKPPSQPTPALFKSITPAILTEEELQALL